MSKLVKRYLYWGGAGVVVWCSVLFLASFIPVSGDSPYMKIHPSPDVGGDTAACEYSGNTEGGLPYRFNFTPEECRLVLYRGSNVIRFSAVYPGMEIVMVGPDDNGLVVTFYMEYISRSDFDPERHLRGEVPLSVMDGVEFYDFGGFLERKFTGRDGVAVYVSSDLNMLRARRLYKSGLWVSYQYSDGFSDVKAMDDFALSVFDKAITK